MNRSGQRPTTGRPVLVSSGPENETKPVTDETNFDLGDGISKRLTIKDWPAK
jgi:hypothetical protein